MIFPFLSLGIFLLKFHFECSKVLFREQDCKNILSVLYFPSQTLDLSISMPDPAEISVKAVWGVLCKEALHLEPLHFETSACRGERLFNGIFI